MGNEPGSLVGHFPLRGAVAAKSYSGSETLSDLHLEQDFCLLGGNLRVVI